MNTKIIAHRGASFLAKHENTLDAFQLAIDIKADYVEFDIRRTRDRKLIVFHNEDIENQNISELTYDEINKIAAKDNYTVPLLMDVLKLCHNKIKLDIELKETGYEKQIINMVTALYDYDDFLMKSFLDTAVARIKAYDPNITAGLLVGKKNGDLKQRFNEYFPERRLKMCSADFIAPYRLFVTSAFVKRMHRQNIPVYIWTVNDISEMKKLLHYGVDGIITDKPDAGIFVKNNYKK